MRDDEKKKLHENLKQEIRSLLISSPKTKYGGLSGSLLYSDYKQLNCGKEIPYAELGFHSFLSLLRSMPDVVRIEHKENSPSYRVHPVYDETTAHIQKMVLEQRDKYQHENQLYNQNWHYNQSNQLIPFNFHNHSQPPFLYNSLCYHTYNNVETNSWIPFHKNTNRLLRRPSESQRVFPLNRGKNDPIYEPYFLLPPLRRFDYEKPNEKMNFQPMDRLPHVSSTLNNDRESCSTPNTFMETPHNFSIDDYRLNQSIKDIPDEKNNSSSIDNQINMDDDPLLTISSNNIPDNPLNQDIDQPFNSPSNNSTISSGSDKIILPPIPDDASECLWNNSECPLQPCTLIVEEKGSPSDNETFFEIPHCAEDELSKNAALLIKRINDAIRECIHFRYIHRLYQLKFEYRYYPLTIEIALNKSKLENIAFNKYQDELEEFEKIFQLDSSLDDQICQKMFNEYVYLQRNYYYMMKLMKKKRR